LGGNRKKDIKKRCFAFIGKFYHEACFIENSKHCFWNLNCLGKALGKTCSEKEAEILKAL